MDVHIIYNAFHKHTQVTDFEIHCYRLYEWGHQFYLHEVASHKCGTACTTSLAMYIHRATWSSYLIDETNTFLQLLLTWCLKNVSCMKLQEIYPSTFPFLETKQ